MKNDTIKQMMRKYPKFVLLSLLFCLIVGGAFYFFDTWKGKEVLTQNSQSLKLLNSLSHPKTGEEWIVSFETKGVADLTISPTDLDTINDLDFVSLTCEGKEKRGKPYRF